MEDQFLKFFDSNKDAVFTNRGFYYQYLVVLKKWITNFINESDVITFTEVDNDVKEVGEVLYFTQIKCYSSTFSFASSELQKAVFDFFILELKYKSLFGEQKFCFYTNTSVAKKEKLLLSWIAEPTLSDAKLKDMAVKKVREIIKDEFNIRKNKKISQIEFQEEIYSIPKDEQPDEIVLETNQYENLMKVVETLPNRSKEAFLLHTIDGYSRKEIASMMGISPNAVEKHIIRATKNLQEKLTK